MTPLRLIGPVALVMLACGPNGSGSTTVITLPADISLGLGEQRTVDGVAIRFVRLVEDSRCPANALCVWAGNAAVELSLAKRNAASVLRVLNSGVEPQVVEEAGLRLSMKELLPYPGTETGTSSGPLLTLRVEKL